MGISFARRLLGACAALLLARPAVALAAPAVQDLVNGAITAVKTKSYQARLKFMSQFDGGAEETVRIYHVAPDLYRVVPLVNGIPGTEAYIENSVELVKVSGDQRLQQLPDRQYYVTDMLTVKFLRDLGNHQGTSVLEGTFNGVPVYYLRQDVTHDKPYLITVGLRKDNYYPSFLQVVDAQNRVRVHYEFESIHFLSSDKLSDDLFTIPEPKQAHRLPSSHLAPQSTNRPALAAPRSAAPGPPSPPSEMPLFPEWLPQGYQLEAISVLDYKRGAGSPALVYHFEIYGPQLDQMLSVFQVQGSAMGDCDLSQTLSPQDGSYLLEKRGDWVIAVFGQIPHDEMQRVIDSLDAGQSDKVKHLLQQTQLRDRVMEQAIESH
jgi:outer membrane lipoprotein-sorting protein